MLLALIQKLWQGTQAMMGVLASLSAMLLVWFIRKEAKTAEQNKALKEALEEVKTDAQKVVDVQRKQAEIAAQPAPDRDAVHEWLRGPSDQDKS